ncbi:MAG: MFS transporter [Burkholderiales bacterium]
MLNRLLKPYRAFLSQPDVPRTLLITFLSRMPVGMLGFAMVMFLRESLGNFKLAGSVIGVYFFAMAVSSPIKGRIIDRIGPGIPLRMCGVLDPLCFALFIAAVWYALPITYVLVCAALMGLFTTPIATLTRAIWRHRFDADDDRRMAFAVDSVLMEINFTMGPAVVGLVLAFSTPKSAILVAWVAATTSILIFMRNPALKYWKQQPPSERHLLGPLTEGRLILLFVILFALAMACGMLEVGYPAYTTSIAIPAFAGVLLAINSFGSAIGGALFGGTKFSLSMEKQFAILLAVFGVLMCLHLAVDAKESRYLFALMAFIAGCAISPAFALQALLISRIAPAKYATEAFTWSGTFIVTGLGAGMAVGGALSELYFVKAPFVAGSAVLIVAAALALLLTARAAPNT